jgi:hypothetical protein
MVMLRPKKLPSEVRPNNPFESDLDEFPNVLNFLEDLSEVRFNSKVWEAFKNWSNLAKTEAHKVLTYGAYPYINVKGTISGTGAAHDHGNFKPSQPNDI